FFGPSTNRPIYRTADVSSCTFASHTSPGAISRGCRARHLARAPSTLSRFEAGSVRARLNVLSAPSGLLWAPPVCGQMLECHVEGEFQRAGAAGCLGHEQSTLQRAQQGQRELGWVGLCSEFAVVAHGVESLG